MFDAHLHLQDERFDACREAVIAAAVAVGVDGGCCCGSAPDDWAAVAKLAKRHPSFSLLPAFGVHPWYAGNLASNWMAILEGFLARYPEAPVGEIGIDGLRRDPPRELQRRVLCAQLELATRLNRPAVLHGARAWGVLLAIVKPFAPRLPGFVLHAFGGPVDILREAVAMGGYLSFAGPVCNPAAKRVRAAAVAVPANRLLIETDAPDMAPGDQMPDDGRRTTDDGILAGSNHLANLVYVARAVAELRDAPVEEIGAITAENAKRIYCPAVDDRRENPNGH